MADIPITDDFICQETTTWSGLGTIDILAAALDITEEQRRDLRNWYERHMAAYKVLSVNAKKGIMNVVNLINDAPYTTRGGEELAQFKRIFLSQTLSGNLIRLRGSMSQSLAEENQPHHH